MMESETESSSQHSWITLALTSSSPQALATGISSRISRTASILQWNSLSGWKLKSGASGRCAAPCSGNLEQKTRFRIFPRSRSTVTLTPLNFRTGRECVWFYNVHWGSMAFQLPGLYTAETGRKCFHLDTFQDRPETFGISLERVL